jgi:tetratricopeptide (TPR) repeat protein
MTSQLSDPNSVVLFGQEYQALLWYFRSKANSWASLWNSSQEEVQTVLKQFDIERPQLRPVFDWLNSDGDPQTEICEGVCDLFESFEQIFNLRLTFEERLEWAHLAKRCAENVGDVGHQCFALHRIGVYEVCRREFDRAYHALYEALHLSRGSDYSSFGQTLGFLGFYFARQGERRRAVRFFHRAYDRAQRRGDDKWLGYWADMAGRNYRRLGDVSTAEKFIGQAYNAAQRREDPRGIATACSAFADIYRGQDRHDEAMDMVLKALSHDFELGDPWNFPIGLRTAARIARETGQQNRLISMIDESDMVVEMWSLLKSSFQTVGELGRVYLDVGRHEEAIGCFEKCAEKAGQKGEVLWECIGLEGQAQAHCAIGEFSSAEAAIDRAVERATQWERKREAQRLSASARSIRMIKQVSGQ